MKIVVLAVGLSPDRDVSHSSGSMIANALLDCGHEVALLDLFYGTEQPAPWTGLFHRKEDGTRFSYVVPDAAPDLRRLWEESSNGGSMVGKQVLEVCRSADLVFLSLHGAMGENGQIQALFDAYGIPYTGSGYIGSLLAMDKDVSKTLLRCEGIATPKWEKLRLDEEGILENHLGYPCVVKPCSCGSSIGVSIVRNHAEWERALAAAETYERDILVEEYAAGREFSVGILDGEALPVIEIVPKQGFYDYTNKYQPGLTEEICPAVLSWEQTEYMQEQALRVHRILRLGYYSRVDFILGAGGTLYCLEANTLPGMTPASLLPQEAQAAGISYQELCEKIAEAALR